MKLIEKILLPIGFEQDADRVLQYGKSIASKFESEVILLHVLPGNMSDGKVRSGVEAKLIEYKDALSSEGIKCRHQITTGNAVDKVVETAKQEDVNIIIVGSGDVHKNVFRLGSHSEKIIRNSEIPVWVVEKESTGKIAKVLCPVDFSEQSKIALESALQICRQYDAKLEVLSVLKSQSSEYKAFGLDSDSEEKTSTDELYPEFDQFLSGFNLTGIEWSKEIKIGSPADEILNHIMNNDIDLVVMGSTGKTRFSRFLIGSVTEKVSRRVPCSLIITKSESLIQLKVEKDLKDIDGLFDEGKKLYTNGYLEEAISIWKRCTILNEFYLKAWSYIAIAYSDLGDQENAKKYSELKEKIQRSIWDKQIEAELRGKHDIL